MVTIVIPVHNEAENLKLVHPKLIETIEALNKLNRFSEVIYVDNNSTDNGYDLLKKFAQDDTRVKVVRLARNFGQTLAIQAGIDYAKGGVLIFMDADMQNDPADILKLLQKVDEGYDVVSGWRRPRNDPLFNKKLPSFIGNMLFSFLFGVKIHDLGCALKAYKRSVFANLRLYGEMHRLLPLYAVMNGASIVEVEVSHNPRLKGKSHYGWSRIFKVALDLITVRFFEKYSTMPIYFFGSVGIGFFILGFLIGMRVIIRTLFFKGIWISPLLFISLLSVMMGIQLVFMGLLAEIIIRIYYKTKTESSYLISEIVMKDSQKI